MPPSFYHTFGCSASSHTKGGATEPEVQAAGACYSQGSDEMHIANQEGRAALVVGTGRFPLRVGAIIVCHPLGGHDFWTPVEPS